MNRPLVHRMGANLPWRKILKLLLIQRVVCTALWYKPLALLFHGIEIGGAAPVCSLTGSLFQISMLLQIVICPIDRGVDLLNMRRLWSHITSFKRFGLLLGASWIASLTWVIPHRNQLIPRAVILLFIGCFDIICTGT
mgnify:CR=1 FL=1